MIRGVGDDFWATFVEGELDDPRTRSITIYGSGAVNVNLAPPRVLRARLCSFLTDQPLCRDPVQAAAFDSLLGMAKSLVPVALFSKPADFISFVTGTPSGGGLDMYTMLLGILGPDSPFMAWTPVVVTPEQKQQLESRFIVIASIFTIQSTGQVGKARAKMTMVVNFDTPWKPPLGVTATRPPLGAVHYYRLE
jgi:general secretion pathway protein K